MTFGRLPAPFFVIVISYLSMQLIKSATGYYRIYKENGKEVCQKISAELRPELCRYLLDC